MHQWFEPRPARVVWPHPAPGGDPDRRLYFLHVPKTGGTSLDGVLRSMYPRGEVCPARLHEEWLELADPTIYRFISGHLSLVPLRVEAAWPEIVTVVREPAVQLRSTYEHGRSVESHVLHEASMRSTFDEWLADPSVEMVARNPQSRHLADALDPDVPSDEELFDRAVETLDRCLWYTTTDQLESSLSRLGHALRWPIPERLLRANVALKAHPMITDQERELVETYAGVDLRVYEYARQQIAALAPVENTVLVEARAQAVRVLDRSLRIEVGEPFWGAGWWPSERASAGTFVRWASLDEPASIELPVQLRAGDRVDVHITDTVDARLVSEMQVTTNGARTDLLGVAPSFATVGAYFVVTEDSTGWTRLELSSPPALANAIPRRHEKWPEGHAFSVHHVVLVPRQ